MAKSDEDEPLTDDELDAFLDGIGQDYDGPVDPARVVAELRRLRGLVQERAPATLFGRPVVLVEGMKTPPDVRFLPRCECECDACDGGLCIRPAGHEHATRL